MPYYYNNLYKPYIILSWKCVVTFREHWTSSSCVYGNCCFSAGRGLTRRIRVTAKEEVACISSIIHPQTTICLTVGYLAANSVWKTCAKTRVAPAQLHSLLFRFQLHRLFRFQLPQIKLYRPMAITGKSILTYFIIPQEIYIYLVINSRITMHAVIVGTYI